MKNTMDIPEGWRVGQQSKVGPQWLEGWASVVATASTDNDVSMLRIILEDRRSWAFPITIRKASDLLAAKAQELGLPYLVVRGVGPELGWHNRLAIKMQEPAKSLTAKSKRMAGEHA